MLWAAVCAVGNPTRSDGTAAGGTAAGGRVGDEFPCDSPITSGPTSRYWTVRPLLRRESRDEARETCKSERKRQREVLASSVTVGSRLL